MTKKRCGKGKVWDENAKSCVVAPSPVDRAFRALFVMDDEQVTFTEDAEEWKRDFRKSNLPKKKVKRLEKLIDQLVESDLSVEELRAGKVPPHDTDQIYEEMFEIVKPHIQRKELQEGPCRPLWDAWATGESEEEEIDPEMLEGC